MKKNILLAAAAVCIMMGLAACGMGKGQENAEEDKVQGTEDNLAERDIEEKDGEKEGEDKEAENEGAEGEDSGGSSAAKEIDAMENDVGKEPDGPENNASGKTETGGNIYIRLDEAEKKYEAEDGTLLLTVTSILPVVTISDNEEAAAAINAYVKSCLPDETEAAEYAKEDYEQFGKEMWNEYEESTEFAVGRSDSAVISFRAGNFSYMGGAHPSHIYGGLNFSTKTGERLALADIVTEEETAMASINEFLLAAVEEEYGEYLYSNYKDYMGDLLTEDAWYLGEDGLHIIVNEYAVAPYVAGDRDLVIPYDEADFLKEEFRR